MEATISKTHHIQPKLTLIYLNSYVISAIDHNSTSQVHSMVVVFHAAYFKGFWCNFFLFSSF